MKQYIVGLGTSAGGLEALDRFFTHMPSHPQLAFLVVQHLSPDYKSHMVELLSKSAQMPVHEATDGVEVLPRNIYLLPPRKNMTIFKGKLYLVDYDRSHGLNLPIDIMLESLAKDQGSQSIACILSGTGSDGTRGIRLIKEHGGIVLAQDVTAKFDGMPRSAISTQLVDYIAPPEKMAGIILRFVENPRVISADLVSGQGIPERDLIGKVLAILRDRIGIDFTGYKPNTLVRRIERRMSLLEIDSLENYIQLLQQSEPERQTLHKEFLIGVTNFFRDTEAFEVIRNDVVPVLMDGRQRGEQVRVWVAGCSTGEEAYSLAMLFQDHMERTGQLNDVKIFATDIDRAALDIASAGVYPESVLAGIPEQMLDNYFVKQDDNYEIIRQIRGMVVFAHQNLITDPPFSRIDLIACRNLLIYLQSNIQAKIIKVFEFALRPGGFLFLGSSESLGERGEDFVVESSKWKVYRFRGNHNPLAPLEIRRADGTQITIGKDTQDTPIRGDWRNSDAVLRQLVESALPPCVVVDESGTLIHAFGDLDTFLRAPRGYQLNLNIMNMIRDSLSIPLSTALHRTFKDGNEVNYSHLELSDNSEGVSVSLQTKLFWQRYQNQKLALVMFVAEPASNAPPVESGETFTLSDSVSQRIGNLEQELQYTRENLQSTIEELETSNEELQATNEELMAANEELQSTNEELESVNEELLTVNNEYQIKIRELSALNDDMNNLLRSIDIGTVFLDADLNVRKFTPAAQDSINLLEQDVGRPIAHFAHNFEGFNLAAAIEDVMDTLIPREYEVQNKLGQWLRLRVVPYRTHSNQITGMVLTIVDVSDLKMALETSQENTEYAQVILNSLAAHIAVMDQDGLILSVNDAWRRFSQENGGSATHTDIGTNYLDICKDASGVNTEGAIDCFNGLRRLLDGEIDAFDLEYPCHAPDRERWFLMRAVPLNTEADNGKRIVISHIDITERKQVENALRDSQKRLQLAARARPNVMFEHDLTLRYTWIQNTDVPYPDESAVGQSDLDLLPREMADGLIKLKRECINQQRSLHRQVHLVADEQAYTLSVLLEPAYDSNENVIGIIGAYTDFVAINEA